MTAEEQAAFRGRYGAPQHRQIASTLTSSGNPEEETEDGEDQQERKGHRYDHQREAQCEEEQDKTTDTSEKTHHGNRSRREGDLTLYRGFPARPNARSRLLVPPACSCRGMSSAGRALRSTALPEGRPLAITESLPSTIRTRRGVHTERRLVCVGIDEVYGD